MQAILWNGLHMAVTKGGIGVAGCRCIGIMPVSQALMIYNRCSGIGISRINGYNS